MASARASSRAASSLRACANSSSSSFAPMAEGILSEGVIDFWVVVAVVVSLMLSAFFAAGETALTATSRARMAALERQGNTAAKRVNVLLGARERLIGAMLIGNNVVNIGASALTTTIFVSLFGDAGVIYATGVMSVLVVVFAEMLPKTIAVTNPGRTARPGAERHRDLHPPLPAPVRHPHRGEPAHPFGDRGIARHRRSPRGGGGGGEIRRRHVRRPPRPVRARGLGRDGPPHEHALDQRRPAARRDAERGPDISQYPPAALARHAGQHHRHRACEGCAARARRRQWRCDQARF